MTTTKSIPKQTARWTMRDETKIRICDMSLPHLINTVKMLERGAGRIYERTVREMYSTSSFVNGEMAELDCENMIRSLEESDWTEFLPEIHAKMLLDMERRGVKLTGP